MRCLLIAIVALIAIGLVVVWPYRSEDVVLRVTANPTRCEIYVRNWSGWTYGSSAPGAGLQRLADPLDVRVFVDSCPGLPRGEPASIALHDAGVTYRGEDCGEEGEDLAYVCRVQVPARLGRYRLSVETERGKPQPVDIEVGRETSWRSATLDALMSV